MMESILQANLVPLGLSPSESGFLGREIPICLQYQKNEYENQLDFCCWGKIRE